MRYLTLELNYDEYLNETLNTITIYSEDGYKEFFEYSDDYSTTLALQEFSGLGYTVRGISCAKTIYDCKLELAYVYDYLVENYNFIDEEHQTEFFEAVDCLDTIIKDMNIKLIQDIEDRLC